MRSLRKIVYSTWGRVFIPLILVGISGVSTNMIAWVITQAPELTIGTILANRWSALFAVSAGMLTWYELKRVSKDINRQEYVNNIMNEITPEIIQSCKDMIKQGKISEAMGNIDITSKMLKPNKSS